MSIHNLQKLPIGRAKLARVLKAAGDTVQIDDVVEALDMERSKASKLLARWTKQGWLKRVGPGVYVSVSLDSLESEQVLEDPWVLVPVLFAPGYIGGWSAAEYWDLTEQIFREIIVMTAQNVRKKYKEVHGSYFLLRHIKTNQIFGTKVVWRNKTKIAISDPHRTIIDMLNDPSIGGGIQHVKDCLINYMLREDHNIQKLIEYAELNSNGAVFKRMGFLVESIPGGEILTILCRQKITQGNAKLDPNLRCPRLITRWRLLVPNSWVGEKQA